MVNQDTEQIIIKIPHEEVVFVDMVFKSHEGLAMLTLSQGKEELVYLDVTEGTRSDILKILNNLKKEFPLEIIKE